MKNLVDYLFDQIVWQLLHGDECWNKTFTYYGIMDEDHKPLFLVIQTSLLSICWSPQSQLQSPVPPIYRRRYHLKFDIELYINT